MNEQEFDNLWQEAEVKEMAHRMAQGYPAWAQRRKRLRNGIVAGMAIGVMTVAAIPLFRPQVDDDYIAVCCNRTDIDDSQWVALAAEMLTTEMI